jgi:hypothetical protein
MCESLGYSPKHRCPLSDRLQKSPKGWAEPNAPFCRKSCVGGPIPEISTLHPVANADALEAVVRPHGGRNGAALLKTSSDTSICVFDLCDCWCANIPSIHSQKSWSLTEYHTHSILELSGMTRIQIGTSCRQGTLEDTHRLRPNLCLQIHHGFDVKVSPAV